MVLKPYLFVNWNYDYSISENNNTSFNQIGLQMAEIWMFNAVKQLCKKPNGFLYTSHLRRLKATKKKVAEQLNKVMGYVVLNA